MVNKVILVGNLGREPEVRTLESGVKVARVSIATNENYRDRNTNEWQSATEWHDLVLWRYNAEKIENYTKGTMVYVEGKLTHRKWTDKEGNDRYTTEVVVNQIKRLSTREQGAENRNIAGETTPPFDTPLNQPTQDKSAGESPELDDDLPF